MMAPTTRIAKPISSIAPMRIAIAFPDFFAGRSVDQPGVWVAPHMRQRTESSGIMDLHELQRAIMFLQLLAGRMLSRLNSSLSRVKIPACVSFDNRHR